MAQNEPPRDLVAARKIADYLAEGHRAIGNFLSEFSQLDFTIRFVLASKLGISKEYFDIVTAPYDFAMLCNVAREVVSKQIPDRANAVKKIFDACLKLNDKRVRVAHGIWTLSNDGLVARHVSRSSLEPKYFFERKDELDGLADEAQRLLQAVLSIGS